MLGKLGADNLFHDTDLYRFPIGTQLNAPAYALALAGTEFHKLCFLLLRYALLRLKSRFAAAKGEAAILDPCFIEIAQEFISFRMEIGYTVPRKFSIRTHDFPNLLRHHLSGAFILIMQLPTECAGADRADFIRHIEHGETIPALRQIRAGFLNLIQIVPTAPRNQDTELLQKIIDPMPAGQDIQLVASRYKIDFRAGKSRLDIFQHLIIVSTSWPGHLDTAYRNP